MTLEEVADGFLCVAVDTMANAIKQVSLRIGLDPADFALSSFGGAAGQVACRVADALGIRSILIHPMAGVLSALGIGLAQTRALRRASLALPLDEAGLIRAGELAADLARSAALDFGSEPVAKIESHIEIRVHRSEFALSVPLTDCDHVRRIFAEQYRRRFGFEPDGDSRLIIAAVVTECIGAEPSLPLPPPTPAGGARSRPQTTECWFDGHWQATRIYRRADLAADECIQGPALIVETTATTVVEPHWQARHDRQGLLLLECNGAPRRQQTVDPALADPILLEVFNGLYTHIAEQMGAVLQQSASSVNIRERLDYSCAIFDADGRLVANAPHMPVHLGSMGASVRAVMFKNLGQAEPGDAYLVNSPYAGGTHLPDLTVVSPVFISGQSSAAFWVASRAHHADIGGITPGSMPPFSRSIREEGALFDGERIVHGNLFDSAGVVMRLTEGPFPARNVPQNLADLAAQLAANARGAEELAQLTQRYGQRVVDAYLEHVQKNAEYRVRSALRALPIAGRGAITNCREMDSGERICVEIRIDAETGNICVDFTGTSPQSPTNFNAPKAVCTAAVLYVLRSLVDDDIPLNEGCLAPLELRIPPGSLLDPQTPAAVVAGNVETSQIIVDLLYGAFGVLADAQGTMNNLTFGDDTCQYYETIAGGSGAGQDFDGADGVQTHMTNSRLTDPEILESRLPVRLERFAYRRGSGGKGLHHGGDGLIRKIRFLRPLEVAILSNRRRIAPCGLAGGHSGAPGINRLVRAGGEIVALDSTASVRAEQDDSIEIETPGGGGYGTPKS
jgi:5-oxoprolinase (ATP-hydrolysing)